MGSPETCLQDLRAAEESLRLALREHEETAGSSRDQTFSLQVSRLRLYTVLKLGRTQL